MRLRAIRPAPRLTLVSSVVLDPNRSSIIQVLGTTYLAIFGRREYPFSKNRQFRTFLPRYDIYIREVPQAGYSGQATIFSALNI
jgi:hypothetical protein